MRPWLRILLFLLIGISSSGKIPANNWHSYLSYYQIIAVTQGDQKIFAANENGLFSYQLSDNSLETRSRVEGLSDSGISAISWTVSGAGVLIGYSNGNLDLLSGNTISNLPDIKLKTSVAKKSINNILCEGDFAWLSCDFGIVKVNLKKWEVAETWFIGPEASKLSVREIVADEQYFWAATDAGIFKAPKNNPNLQDYHNWILQNQLPAMQKQFNSIALFNKKIYTCDTDEKIYSFDGFSWQSVYAGISGIRKIKSFPAAMALIGSQRIEIVTTGGGQSTISNYGQLTPATSKIFPSDALITSSGDLWIGDRTFGLIHKTGNGLFNSVVPSSPADNYSRRLTISGANLYVATGKDDNSSDAIPAEIHRLQDQHWFSLNAYTDNGLSGLSNITAVVASPVNPEHFWGSTKAGGLLEFNGQKSVKNYNSTNSSLESFNGICKTGGLTNDASGNLWITNPSVKHQLHVIKADGTWISLSYPGIDNQFVAAGDITITRTNTKWIVVNNSDLFALRTGNTIDNTTDDLYKKTTVRSKFSNSETTIIKGFTQINALVEDLNGYLWVGTESGIVLYYNPEALFGNNEFYGVQPSVDLEDGLFHPLLENINVNAIAVDGGNRKWFGTTNSGVFLFSEDGTKLIHHFNTDNSPLFSNHVTSIAVNGQSGEVFFATERGLISWMGSATDGGGSFQHLYVWPNPVRETYQGEITIDGLVAESTVRITDVTGNLVYKTTSNGGRALWNGQKSNGERVSTGVYLIFCSDNEGNQSRVIKLLFIH
jgi:hypothetical protein